MVHKSLRHLLFLLNGVPECCISLMMVRLFYRASSIFVLAKHSRFENLNLHIVLLSSVISVGEMYVFTYILLYCYRFLSG
jgi:hypothetical protein